MKIIALAYETKKYGVLIFLSLLLPFLLLVSCQGESGKKERSSISPLLDTGNSMYVDGDVVSVFTITNDDNIIVGYLMTSNRCYQHHILDSKKEVTKMLLVLESKSNQYNKHYCDFFGNLDI